MTRIKLCGLTRPCDIEWANALTPDYIGFVFARKSRRYVAPERASALRAGLDTGIRAVGVFVNEVPEAVAALLNGGVIDIAQLHGGEDADYIRTLRKLTDRPLIQAFRVDSPADLERAMKSAADYILLDNGPGGTGTPRLGVVVPQRPGPIRMASFPCSRRLRSPTALATAYFCCSGRFRYGSTFTNTT